MPLQQRRRGPDDDGATTQTDAKTTDAKVGTDSATVPAATSRVSSRAGRSTRARVSSSATARASTTTERSTVATGSTASATAAWRSTGAGSASATRPTPARDRLTACAWIRPEALPAAGVARGYIVGKLADPNDGGWRLAVGRAANDASVATTMNFPTPDGGANETNGGTMALDTWHHVCGVFSGRQLRLRQRRAGAPTRRPPSKITTTADEVRIGIRGDGIEPVRGRSRRRSHLRARALASRDRGARPALRAATHASARDAF